MARNKIAPLKSEPVYMRRVGISSQFMCKQAGSNHQLERPS